MLLDRISVHSTAGLLSLVSEIIQAVSEARNTVRPVWMTAVAG
jgi:hypothetical protein